MGNRLSIKHAIYALFFLAIALLKPCLVFAAGGALGPDGLQVQASDYVAQPPLAVTGADPFLMIDLSVELTQQAEAYTDGAQTYTNGTKCGGRLTSQPWNGGTKDLGVCYSANETYIGYFDPAKCYTYDVSTYSNSNTDQQATGPRSNAAPHFYKPTGLASTSTTTVNGKTITVSTHKCSNQFSGNFLNWASMTALDEFRSAMTGGARLIDTAGSSASTMLIRTRRFDDWDFVFKSINNNGISVGTSTFINNPWDVTPFTSSQFDPPAVSTGTTSCSCNASNAPSKCTKPSSSSKNADGCSCSQTVTNNYTAKNDLLVVNNWSGLGAGQSLHKTRFYSYNRGNVGTTQTTTYTYSGGTGYTCPVATTSTTAQAAPTLLTVGGDSNVNVIVKVCDPGTSSSSTGGVEANCVKYTDGTNVWYKPEGLLQKNSLKMTYALNSYTGRSGNAINGGVLRANAKYIGAQMPTTFGGIQDNPNKEVDSNGVFVFDPDKLAGKTGVNGIAPVNSGILNYINQFALFAGKYKANDPDAELYYEGLRYLMNLGPTPSFANPLAGNGGPLTAAEQDGYPVFGGTVIGALSGGSPTWTDPIVSSCQKNYALYVGDKNPHRNNYLPNGYSLGSDDPTCSGGECQDAIDKGINTGALEDSMGGYESPTFSKTTNRGRNDGYGLAALAWWANTHDIRTDKTGDQRVKTFIVDTQEYSSDYPVGASNALWVAAKWGGFEDSTGNNVVSTAIPLASTPKPDLSSEWNAKGGSYTNGTTATALPDTYTLASQPANMVAGLTSAFSTVSSSTGAAAAAAVVANSSVGTATVYQALFRPRISNSSSAITWAGTVRGFFIDDQGRFREDTDGDGRLTVSDNVIVFRVDTTSNQTVVDRYTPGGTLVMSGIALNSVSPIWDANNQLANLTNTQIVNQRTYANTADTGRYIFTWIDTNNNGVVDSGEIKDFTAAQFPNINATSNDSTLDPARLLGLDSVTGSKSTALVNYIRGLDQTGYRGRTIDDGSGSKTYRLGDIVHSAALVVGAPSQNFDSPLSANDNSYAAFKTRYTNRRQVLYVGANDGMLHAFNGGFFGAASDGSPGYYTASNLGAGPEVKHPLGGELWAYVPYNLLPHLQDIADPAYSHEYFVDGTPQQFDVNMFNDCTNVATCDHPYGWGTILVVGFRLGGGDLTVNATTDQTSAADAGNRTLRSAYLVFDITNPEKAPTLLAELTQPTLGFTVSKPVVVKRRVADSLGSFTSFANGSNSTNQWYLVIGSGPAGTDPTSKQLALNNAVSNQQARIFSYDLTARAWVDADTSTSTVDPFLLAGENNSFVGDMTAADWNNDYNDEVIYFGTVGTAALGDQIGDLLRMQMPASYVFGTPTFTSLLTGNTQTPSNGQPFSSAPFISKDSNGQPWVYAGTGRFYVGSDIQSTKQMSFYGIKEPLSGSVLTYAAVPKSNLVNTTGIQVFDNGSVKDASGNTLMIGTQTVTGYDQLVQTVSATPGWYFNFNGTSERFVDSIFSYYDSLIFIAYTPSGDTCNPAGSSRIVAASLASGTGSPYAPLGINSLTHLINTSLSLGFGQYFGSGLVTLGSGSSTKSMFTYIGSAGNMGGTFPPPHLTGYGRRTSWRELPLQ